MIEDGQDVRDGLRSQRDNLIHVNSIEMPKTERAWEEQVHSVDSIRVLYAVRTECHVNLTKIPPFSYPLLQSNPLQIREV